MTNLDDPEAVAAELRRRGLPGHRAADTIIDPDPAAEPS